MKINSLSCNEVKILIDKAKHSKYPQVWDVINGVTPGVVFRETSLKSAQRLRNRLISFQKKYAYIKVILRGEEVILYDSRKVPE